MIISSPTWNDLLKRLNSTEEPLCHTALLVHLWNEPEWPPSFRVFPVSPVDWDIAPDSPVPVVLANLPGIISRICRDDHWLLLRPGNLECFKGWFIEP